MNRLKEIQREVDLMNKSLGMDIPDEPEVEDPEVEEPEEMEPSDDLDLEPETEPEPDDVEEPEEPDEVEEPEPETDERDQTISELRAKLAELESKESKPASPATEVPLEIAEQNFLDGIDFDDVSADPNEFNKLLNKIYKQTVTDTERSVGEKISKSLPSTVRELITVTRNMQEASENFYKENKDLKPFKKVVATVFDDLAAENSDKTYEEVLKEVGPETRRRLELPTPTTKLDKGDPPRLPRKKGKLGRTDNTEPLTGIEAEIEAMNATLGR